LPSTEATPSDAPTEISQFDKEIITVYLRENTENSVKPPSVRPDKQVDPRDGIKFIKYLYATRVE
jgi:hypothetical protein